MRKITLIIGMILLSLTLQGQTTLKRGAVIGNGGNTFTIDSIIKSSTFFKLYNGATELLSIDTATMLTKYIQRSDTSGMLTKYARKASPTFTGTVTIPTPFKIGAVSVTATGTQLNYLNAATGATGTGNSVFSASPTLTGTPLAPTAAPGTNTTQIATTAFAHAGLALKVNISDTAAMLVPYINRVDTSGMLTPYINRVDTATMLTPYARKTSPTFTGVPKISTDTIATRAYARSYGGTGASYAWIDSANYYNGNRVFNIIEYGAIPNDGISDYAAIQAAIDAACAVTGQRAAVYVPSGVWNITDTLEVYGDVYNYGIDIYGNGFSSRIYNTGTTASLYLKNISRCKISDLLFKGNGGNYGAGGTTGEGIILDGAKYMFFENIYVLNHGSHGVNLYNDAWGVKFENCFIENNAGSGIYAVSIIGSTNANTLAVTNSELRNNGDDGMTWAGAMGLTVNGSAFENNAGSGLQIGSPHAITSSSGASIEGAYFENNDSAQIFIVGGSYVTPSTGVYGIVIEGNWIGTNGTGDVYDALIKQVVQGGEDYYLFFNSYIGANHYYLEDDVVYNVSLYREAPTVTVRSASNYSASAIDKDYATIELGGIPMYQAVQRTIPAADGFDADDLYPEVIFYNTLPIDITAGHPQIIAGFVGQRIKIWGSSDTNTLTLEDGDGLKLNGDIAFVLGLDDVIELEYRPSGYWCELYRSDN